ARDFPSIFATGKVLRIVSIVSRSEILRGPLSPIQAVGTWFLKQVFLKQVFSIQVLPKQVSPEHMPRKPGLLVQAMSLSE
ncbi:MAG: hypothetical protein ACI8Z1_003711, partial [Candidatus Azotimanducaceae bacterium]